MDAIERDALLVLSLTPGLGPTLTRRCLEAMGSARAALSASRDRLSQVEGIGPRRADSIRRGMDGLSDGIALSREKELIERHHATVIFQGDPDYPPLLKHIPDPPPVLYVRGRIEPTDSLALAVVGARNCSAYGREQADRLSAFCAQAGLCVVSGGAYGIDAAAHHAVLRAGGRTIAVLGSGLGEPYPRDHIELFDDIIDGRGAVVSELPMSTPPAAENFPRRNRIISGLALGVLVVEASQRSGALITARLCSEEHNREVMALPGRVDSPASAGCHKIIREGWATLVTSGADVLDALGEAGAALLAGMQNPAAQNDGAGSLFDSAKTSDEKTSGGGGMLEQGISAEQKRIVEALGEPRSLDQLVAATGLAPGVVQGELTVLQIRGLVTKEGIQFSRRRR